MLQNVTSSAQVVAEEIKLDRKTNSDNGSSETKDKSGEKQRQQERGLKCPIKTFATNEEEELSCRHTFFSSTGGFPEKKKERFLWRHFVPLFFFSGTFYSKSWQRQI